MTSTYTYSLAGDFGGNLNSSQLVTECEAAAIGPTTLYVNTSGDVVDVVFDAALSGGEQTTLNGVVSAHVAEAEASAAITSTGTAGTETVLVTTQTANRTLSLPDATDTLVGRNTTDTLTNKTIDGGSNTITNLNAGSVATGTFANARISAASVTQHEASLTLSNLGGTLGVNKGGTGATTLTSGGWLQGNGTGSLISIKNNMGAAVAPTTSADTAAGYAVGSRWFNTTSNSEYVCLNATNGAAVWIQTTVIGEVNTASSSGGTSLVLAKSGVNLPFKGLAATSTKIALTANATTVGINVTEANLILSNMGGTLGVNKGGTGATTLTSGGWLQGNGTDAMISIKNNMNASVAPTTSADAAAGYAVGSRWFDTTSDDEYSCLDATNGAAVWKSSTLASLISNEISATGSTSTTSGTYVLLNSMTTTPAAGTYIVMFSSSGAANSNGADGMYAIFVGGAVVTHTARRLNVNGGSQAKGFESAMYTQARVTVTGSQDIDVRYQTSSGTFSVNDRNMIIVKI